MQRRRMTNHRFTLPSFALTSSFHPHLLFGLLLTLVGLLGTSCQRDEAYLHYEDTDVTGWSIAERLDYGIPPLEESGDYLVRLHLRTTPNNPFPFKVLYLEVREERDSIVTIDTLACPLSTDDAATKGIVVRQSTFDIRRLYCNRGDSVHYTVRHIMRQEDIPGISDVGISLERVKE